VPKTDLGKALPIVKKIAQDIGAKDVTVNENITKISIVGVGMKSHAGVASKMFKVLSDEGINIMMISTSEIKISCAIDAKYTELAVRVLHSAFGLDKPGVTEE
jgi:aspartate kinase